MHSHSKVTPKAQAYVLLKKQNKTLELALLLEPWVSYVHLSILLT